MLIDTHAHLFWDSYEDVHGVIERANQCGVSKMVVPGIDLNTSKKAIELARKYPGIVYAAVGIHPEEAGSEARLSVNTLRELIANNKEYIVAIGEIGTDANTDEMIKAMPQQLELFVAQALIAIDFDLPVIVHTRKSLMETLTALDQLTKMPTGIFHSFSHDMIAMQEILKRHFLVGIGGNVSYSKRIQGVVKELPNNGYVLETDSPFLPRDFLNEPSSVTILASTVAKLRGESVNKVHSDTTNNAKLLFNI